MQSRTTGSTGTWLLVSGVYAALTLLYGWPLLTSLGSRLPGDLGDPGLNTWIIWWNAHALPFTARWWNAPIFFPTPGALALSESLLGLAPLTTPLQWLGVTPAGAYDVAFLLSFFSAGLAAHALAHRLTGRHAAGLVAGVAYGFNPYRAAHIPHLQILMSCWMPVGLLALHAYSERGRRRDLLLAGVAWTMNGLTNGYFLMFFAVLAGGWVVWFARTWRQRLAIAGTLGLASLPLVPLLAGYHHYQQALGVSRGISEITLYSADLSSIWAASPVLWLSRHWTLAPLPEGELYPGVVVLTLAVTALGVERRLLAVRPEEPAESGIRRRTRQCLFWSGIAVALAAAASWAFGGWQISAGGLHISMNRPHKAITTATWLVVFSELLHPRLSAAWRNRTPSLFYLVAAAAMFVLALGPLPRAFGVPIFYKAPYAGLMALPGGHSLRVPARFGMLVMLCLSQVAALAVARWSGRHRWAIAALVLLVALDGWVPVLRTAPVPPPVDLAGLDATTPVLEVPMPDLYADTAAMLRATAHGHPLVNGYSGYEPESHVALRTAIQTLDPSGVAAIRRRGPLLVIVDPARDPDGRFRAFVSALPDARLLRDTPAGVVFALPATHGA